MRVAQAFFSSAGSCRHPAWLCVAPPSCGRSLTFCHRAPLRYGGSLAGCWRTPLRWTVSLHGRVPLQSWVRQRSAYMAADGLSAGGMATSGISVAVAGAVYGYLYLPLFFWSEPVCGRLEGVISGLMLLTYMTTQLFQVCFLTPKFSES